jgi:hypothetical protein
MDPRATSAEELQAQIRQARQDLDVHSQEMLQRARAEFNWRNVIAKHPLLALGTAATAGFLLAPRGGCCRHADAGTARPAMESAAPPSSAVSRLMTTFLSAATAILVREGSNLAAGLVLRWLNSRADSREAEPDMQLRQPRTMSNGAAK